MKKLSTNSNSPKKLVSARRKRASKKNIEQSAPQAALKFHGRKGAIALRRINEAVDKLFKNCA